MEKKVVVVGGGMGGLAAGALLAKAGMQVVVLEAQAYPGGCAGTFFHKKYRFDAGATVAGGFQAETGPHALLAEALELQWPVERHDPAWVVHLPEHHLTLTEDNASILSDFPSSAPFWREQQRLASLCWSLSASGFPWPPRHPHEWGALLRTGVRHLPGALRLAPFAFRSVLDWLRRYGLEKELPLVRFLDAQLLISAQATASSTNAIYGATALDLARQGVYHVKGGMGALAQTLVDKIRACGGEVHLKHKVTRLACSGGRVQRVHTSRGADFSCDAVLANLPPGSLAPLLADVCPKALQREVAKSRPGWGAFVLHLGLEQGGILEEVADHHQFIGDLHAPLGEGNSVFLSLSPVWDPSRAPSGHRAATVTTHTAVEPWWSLLRQDEAAYQRRKEDYTERVLSLIERDLPGFREQIRLCMPGTPVTYEYYTGRAQGAVGGFAQTSLFKARTPHTGVPNLLLVGDSVFPGQSTAAVLLGAMRVVEIVKRSLPLSRRFMSRKNIDKVA